jgi:hypothetical protein
MDSKLASIASRTALCFFASVAGAAAQIVIPTAAYETLDVELTSLRDDVTIYMGDPQELLMMSIRPRSGIEPRVEFTSQSQAVLRIRDPFLFRKTESDPEDESGKKAANKVPDSQTWELRLSPSGPTRFAMQCEQGKNRFDFTDMQVERVQVQADGTQLDVEFSRPNPIALEQFYAQMTGGALQFHNMLNARAKEIALLVPQSACQFEVTGKPFDGESAIIIQGAPASVKLVVSGKIGLRVIGSAATTAHFEAAHGSRSGDDWMSKGYEKAKCRVQLTFSEDVPGLEVVWD